MERERERERVGGREREREGGRQTMQVMSTCVLFSFSTRKGTMSVVQYEG